MSIKMFLIGTGDHILGDIVKETETEITITSPMKVMFRPEPSGKLGINLFPLNPFAASENEETTFGKHHIMFYVNNVEQDLVNEYVRMTSGITIANRPDLVKLAGGKK